MRSWVLIALLGLVTAACGNKKSDDEPTAPAPDDAGSEAAKLPDVRRPPADLVELSRKVIEARKALAAETDPAEKARLQEELDQLQAQRRALLMQRRGR
jgi:hypothetical protein